MPSKSLLSLALTTLWWTLPPSSCNVADIIFEYRCLTPPPQVCTAIQSLAPDCPGVILPDVVEGTGIMWNDPITRDADGHTLGAGCELTDFNLDGWVMP
jgi:hypothetical protein